MNAMSIAVRGTLFAAVLSLESRAAEVVLRYEGPLETHLNTVCWTGTKYVAGGDMGLVMASPDGVVWTTVTTPVASNVAGSPAWLSSAAGGGSIIIGGEQSRFLFSNDGITWNSGTVSTGSHYLTAAAISGGTLTLAGSNDDVAFVSSDGSTWTPEAAPAEFRSLTTDGAGAIGWSDSFQTQSLLRRTGGTWESITTNLTVRMRNLVWTGVRYVGVGDSGTVATSTDATTWTPRTSGVSTQLNHVIWTGSHAVAVGAGGKIITSPNGADWTVRSSGTTKDLTGVASSGTGVVAVGKDGVIVRSPDGTGASWLVARPVPNPPVRITGVGWTGSGAFAIGSNAETLTSPDGISWTRTAAGPGPFGVTCIAAGAGRVVIGDSIGGLWSCPADGSSWALTFSPGVIGVIWDGTRFLALTQQTDSHQLNYLFFVRTSPDGLTWSGGTYVGQTSLGDFSYNLPRNDIVFTGQRYVTGTGTSTDGATWQTSFFSRFRRAFRTSDSVVAVNSSGSVSTSADGLTWSTPVASNINPSGVAWTGSRMLAVAGDGVYSGSPGRQWQKIHDFIGTRISWTGTRALIVSNGSIYSLEDFDSLALPVTWETWLEDYFTPAQMQDPAVTGALADPEGDGIPNVIEYVTGADPTAKKVASLITVLPSSPGQGARFQWQQESGRTEVRVKAETSHDLSLWDDATITPVSGTDGGLRTMQVTVPSGIAKIYFRLRVQLFP